MKLRFSSFLAAWLLAGFLAGGAVAPTLHRVHHAQQQHDAAQQARCAHGAHDAPAVEESGASFELEPCWVLARHVLDVPPQPVQGAVPPRGDEAQDAVASARYTSRIEGRFVIRGPPRA